MEYFLNWRSFYNYNFPTDFLVWSTGCPILKCAFWKCSCRKTVNHIDRKWWFLKSQHNIFWYSCLTFAKKKKEMIKIFIWRKKKFCIINFFLKFFEKFFPLQILFWDDLKRKKKFKKIFKKNFDPKKIRIFFQIEIFYISLLFFAKVRFEYQMS